MNHERDLKVIAFPWSSIDVPRVLISWIRKMVFELSDPGLAWQSVWGYRNQGPEAQAPCIQSLSKL